MNFIKLLIKNIGLILVLITALGVVVSPLIYAFSVCNNETLSIVILVIWFILVAAVCKTAWDYELED